MKKINNLCESGACQEKRTPFVIGKKYFIRTVTLYHMGEVSELYPDALVLKDACWIPDTGRFYDFLKVGCASEAEPFLQDAIVFFGGIIDATEWSHDLIKVQR